MANEIKEYMPSVPKILHPLLELRCQILTFWYRNFIGRNLTYFVARHRFPNAEELKRIDLYFIQHYIFTHNERGIPAGIMERIRYKQIRRKYNKEFKVALRLMYELSHGDASKVSPADEGYILKYYGNAEGSLNLLADLFH